ncbi:DUF2637 domain-containing protein [Streptomyces melanogenes]|uniref:DUF2637 domain-containing protein n=1 Tax=Streptomyces melanogenes TaxID=67326 RepID=UPI0037B6A815
MGEERRAVVFGRTHRVVTGVVVAGAMVIAGIGFAGSYAAVRALAEKKGFGTFSLVFPIGIDAGILEHRTAFTARGSDIGPPLASALASA